MQRWCSQRSIETLIQWLLLLLLQMSRFKWRHHNRCGGTLQSAPLPPIDTIWAMMIVWRTSGGYRTARAVLEAIIAFSAMHTYYEQLLQVKQICLCLTVVHFTVLRCICVFVFSCISLLLYFTTCMLYYCNMVGCGWWDWGLIWWLTILLQCFDTVGWVTWPVKNIVPEWPILCRMGR